MTEMLLGNDNTIEFQRSYGMIKRVGYYTSIIGKDNDLLKENGSSYTARPEMNFEQFKEYIKNTILSYLPAEFADASVKVERFNKLGQSYTALYVMKPGEDRCPALNLNQYYSAYQNNESLNKMILEMADAIRKGVPEIELSYMDDYAAVKERLFIRVNSFEKNKELLKNVPHKVIGDLAITSHVLIDSDENRICSTIITNDLLSRYKVDQEQLFDDALNNSVDLFPAVVSDIRHILRGFGAPIPREPNEKPEMIVITNTQSVNGAAVIFYPGIMEALQKELGDYYVIPSSVNELIAVPKNMIEPEELEKKINEVNLFSCPECDRLSDHLYSFDSKTKTLKQVNTRTMGLNRKIPDYLNERSKSYGIMKNEKKEKVRGR